jgi:hypothetical protein
MPTDTDNTWIPHLKIQIGGTIGQPAVEIWSNSFRYRVTGSAPTPAQLLAIADAAAPYVTAWITRGASALRTAVVGQYVKAVWVQSNGKQRDANTAQHDLVAAANTGTLAAAGIWPQTYCLTFRTAVKRGRAHSGRIYPPLAGNGAQGGTPYLALGDAQAMANSGSVLLTGLHLAASGILSTTGGRAVPAVFSPGNALRGTQPVSNDIVAVVVDRVADIMHSRTNRVARLESAPDPVNLSPA